MILFSLALHTFVSLFEIKMEHSTLSTSTKCCLAHLLRQGLLNTPHISHFISFCGFGEHLIISLLGGFHVHFEVTVV